MFKFVLCAVLAVAVAEPGALIAPYSYPAYPGYPAYTSYLAPATTTITKSASSIVHPAPYYSAPFAYPHYIKKRSAPFYAGSYYAPSTYFASAPYVAPALATPIVHSTPYVAAPAFSYSAPTHFIKKRSVGLLPSTYIAPAATYTAASPLLTSSYSYSASAPAYYPSSAPFYSSPYGYSHFIKKRSVGLLPSTYIAPATYAAAPAVVTSSYAAPFYHSSYSTPYFTSPFAYSTYIKK